MVWLPFKGKVIKFYIYDSSERRKSDGSFRVFPLKFNLTLMNTSLRNKTPAYIRIIEFFSNFMRWSFLIDNSDSLTFSNTIYYFKDFERTHIASRFGEAVGYLFMEKQGYQFSAHFEDVVYPEIKKSKRPDYLFLSNINKSLSLVEFKGHWGDSIVFNFKRDLKKYMDTQVIHWIGTPLILRSNKNKIHVPSKGWVTSSYFNGQNSSEIHALDPVLDGPAIDDPEPILRENYGRWLQIMGLDEFGLALRLWETIGVDLVPEIPFEVKHIAGRDFAFPCWEKIKSIPQIRIVVIRQDYCMMPLFINKYLFPEYLCFQVVPIRVGLLLNTLKKVFRTLRTHEELDWVETPPKDLIDKSNENVAYFSDGAVGMREEEYKKYDVEDVIWL